MTTTDLHFVIITACFRRAEEKYAQVRANSPQLLACMNHLPSALPPLLPLALPSSPEIEPLTTSVRTSREIERLSLGIVCNGHDQRFSLPLFFSVKWGSKGQNIYEKLHASNTLLL